MEAKNKRLLSFVALALFVSMPRKALAINDVQKSLIQSTFLSGGLQCIKDNPLTADDIKSFKNKMLPAGEHAKCFAACLFKKIGIMDDMGKVTQAGALESAKKVFSDDDHLKRVEEFIIQCSSVNDQKVSDGNMGCERAVLAFQCLTENAPKFGFNVDF